MLTMRTTFIGFVILALSLSKVSECNAARILAYFPTPSISHQVVFRPLTQELLKRRHEVTVITTDPAFPRGQAPKNFTEIDVHDISYKKYEEVKLYVKKQTSYIAHITALAEMFANFFEVQLKDEHVQEVLHKDKHFYDVLLIEACVRPALILSHIFKAPVIQISSFGATPVNSEAMGVPGHPFLYPNVVRKRIYNLTIWEKVKELFIELYVRYIIEKTEIFENEVLRRNFGPDVPTIQELTNNIDMLFLNTHSIWTENIPVPPSVIFIGGIHTKTSSPLPEDLESYLNSSINGVIYLSFGTNVQSFMINSDIRQKLLNVLSKLPYDILWKWDEELPGRTDNIKTSRWFPQADLLKHPKIKLFITQGGLQSLDESISAGVPLIGFPLIADQSYNIEKVVRFNIGLKLNMDSFTEDELRTAITNVIEDKRYRENVVKLRAIMYDQPQSPLERALWWTEHVLRYSGARHLRAPAANMSWAEYLELKLLFFLLFVLCVILIPLVVIVKLLFRLVSVLFKSVKVKVL